MKNIQHIVDTVFEKYKNCTEGQNASYIPELSKANKDHFAIVIYDIHGNIYSAGDTSIEFTLQSTSKPLVYSLALTQHGIDDVHAKVGVEPTGEAFNSIIELEENTHRPFNPMINSGAIATTSLIIGNNKLQTILNYFESFINRKVIINEQVYQSEQQTAHRNRAIAYLMKHFKVLENDIEETLELYFKQCSVLFSTKDLALVAATFANFGVNPLTKKEVLNAVYIPKVLSLMFTCGMYDSTGEWAFKVGLPSKSGVSGAIFSVVPGKYGIAAFSPPVNQHGHSIRSMKAIEELSIALNLNIFNKKED